MRLSIITINYNNREGLADTIKSVEAQTVKDFEWIVVDGGSTDGSRELLEKHADSISNWVSEPDSGIYNAMNKGIRMSEGEYLLFLNSGDTLVNEHIVEQVLPYLKDVDYLIGSTYHSKNIGVQNVNKDDFKVGKLAFRLIANSLPHQASFMRKTLFAEYGFYREDLKIVSDWAFMIDSIVLGKVSVRYLPLVVAVYDDNGISSTDKQLNKEEREKVIAECPRLKEVLDFYKDNYEMIDALRGNIVVSFINRFFYFLKRKF